MWKKTQNKKNKQILIKTRKQMKIKLLIHSTPSLQILGSCYKIDHQGCEAQLQITNKSDNMINQ